MSVQAERANGCTAPPPGSPTLVIVAGLPGSGKSWFARRLRQAFEARHPGLRPVVIVESDRIRAELTDGRPTHAPEESRRVHAEVRRRAATGLQGGAHVIVDATSLTRVHRATLRRLAARLGARALLAWCEAPDEVATARFARRARREDIEDASGAGAEVAQAMRPIVERPDRAVLVTPARTHDAVETLVADLGGEQPAQAAQV